MKDQKFEIDLKTIIAGIFAFICATMLTFGFFFSAQGPNFLEGIFILGCWIGGLTLVLYPYWHKGTGHLKILAKRGLYAHAVLLFVGFAFTVTYPWSEYLITGNFDKIKHRWKMERCNSKSDSDESYSRCMASE